MLQSLLSAPLGIAEVCLGLRTLSGSKLLLEFELKQGQEAEMQAKIKAAMESALAAEKKAEAEATAARKAAAEKAALGARHAVLCCAVCCRRLSSRLDRARVFMAASFHGAGR